MDNKTDKFLNGIRELLNIEIDEKVMKRAEKSLLDYVAVTVAGAAENKNRIAKFIKNGSVEKGKYKAVGVDGLFSLKDAVFLNGLNGHTLDFDDGTNAGIIHLGSPIFSCLLPLAQKHNIPLERFLRSAIIGYEASFTMAISAQPKLKQNGYHATPVCGILGIVTAICYMLGLDFKTYKEAFSTAAVSASGTLSVLDDGSQLKPYNVAKIAVLGLISVQMALAGYHGHPDILGSERGYLKLFTGSNETELQKPLLNGTWAIEKTYTKPYAACRYCHPSIGAAINLSKKYNLKPENIENIKSETYYWAVYKHDHTDIPCSASAKMSIPYGIAVGIINRTAGFMQYTEDAVKDERVLSLAKKVRVFENKTYTNQYPNTSSATVTITLKNGDVLTETVDFPKGEPENPLSEEEFFERFVGLFNYADKPKETAKDVYCNLCDSDKFNEMIKKL